MQKFTVKTKTGHFHTTDFNEAIKTLREDLKEQRRGLEETFQSLVEEYLPSSKQEILKLKYSKGGKAI